MTILLICLGVIAAALLLFSGYLIGKKIIKPLIEELKEPSKEIIDYSNDGKLDEYQKVALRSPYKQTLVLAGAGAGKTAILTKRIILFAKFLQIPISKMLVMAFNTDAAKEVAERVATAIGHKPISLKDNIRTIHSFAREIAMAENTNLEILAKEKDIKNFVKKFLEKYRSGTMRSIYIGRIINLFNNSKPKDKLNKKRKIPEPGKPVRCSDGTMVRSKAEMRIVE